MFERYLMLSDLLNKPVALPDQDGLEFQEEVDFEVLQSRGLLPPPQSNIEDFYTKLTNITFIIDEVESLSNRHIIAPPSMVPLITCINKIVLSSLYVEEQFCPQSIPEPKELLNILKEVATINTEKGTLMSLLCDNVFITPTYCQMIKYLLDVFIECGLGLDTLMLPDAFVAYIISVVNTSDWEEKYVPYFSNYVNSLIFTETFVQLTEPFNRYTNEGNSNNRLVDLMVDLITNPIGNYNLTFERYPPSIDWLKQVKSIKAGVGVRVGKPYKEVALNMNKTLIPQDVMPMEFIESLIARYKLTGTEYLKELDKEENWINYITFVVPQHLANKLAQAPFLIKRSNLIIQRYDRECSKPNNVWNEMYQSLVKDPSMEIEKDQSLLNDYISRIPFEILYYLYVQTIEGENVVYIDEDNKIECAYLGDDVLGVMQVCFLKFKPNAFKGLKLYNFNYLF